MKTVKVVVKHSMLQDTYFYLIFEKEIKNRLKYTKLKLLSFKNCRQV